MSDLRLINPKGHPERAAQEVVVALCETGAFGIGTEHKAMGAEDGEAIAQAIIATHEKLTEYYRGLKN